MTTSLPATSSSPSQLLRVGDLARATGKSTRAIHLYEELGLLKPATRSSGGFRLFDASAIDRVRWIDSLHGLGFSLQEMREVLKNWWTSEQGSAAMADLRALFARKLDETRDALRRHEQLARELEEGLRYLETCETCAAPGSVHACVNCQQDHGVSPAPALVVGIKAAPESARRTNRPAFVRVEDMTGPRAATAEPVGAEARKERES